MGCAEHRDKESLFSYRNQYQMVSYIRSRNINAVEDLFRKGFHPDFKMPAFQGRTPLHIAVAAGLRGICDVILRQEGVKVDTKDDSGFTPLMIAVDTDSLEIAKLLLEQSPAANPHTYNKLGKNAFSYAAEGSKMKKLLEDSEWGL